MDPELNAPDDRAWWRGRIQENRPGNVLELRRPLEAARGSGAGAFLGLADDGQQYWIKLPGNPQGTQILANEHIVGTLAQTLEAACPAPKVIHVSADLYNVWSERPLWFGHRARIPADVFAHASPRIRGAVEDPRSTLEHIDQDDNRHRHATIVGLWDLCLGFDEQWIYSTVDEYSVWSFDHGYWFQLGEDDWTPESLRRLRDTPNELVTEDTGLEIPLRAFADRIDSLSAADIAKVLSKVPTAWGCTIADLEWLGWLLWWRRRPVAERLRRRATRSGIA